MLKRVVRTSLLILLLISACLALDNLLCAGENSEIAPRIEEADHAIQHAFAAVSNAEEEGVRVTEAIARLNEAARLLDEARMAYRNGDLSVTLAKTDQCIAVANSVTSDTLNKKVALGEYEAKILWWSIAFSSFGIEAFIIGLFFAWDRFKRIYSERILKLKPEVASSVEA